MQEFLLESCNNFIDKDITVPAFEKYENNIARINASLIKKHVSGEYTKKSKQWIKINSLCLRFHIILQ